MYLYSLSRRKEVVIHLIFWVIWGYFSLITVGADGIGFARIGLFSWTWVLVYSATFYFHYLLILPKIFQPFRWGKLLGGGLASTLFFCGIRYFIEQFLTVQLFGDQNYLPGTSLLYYLYDNLFIASRPLILSSALWIIIFLVRLMEDNKRILEENKNTEIKFLKAQINPHFIFNTLNNIYSMVYFESDKSLSAIQKLSQIMRFTTYEAQKEKITLTEELAYIQAYIDLERLRHEEDYFVTLDIAITQEHLQIPPYILSPLVENALKHGLTSSASPIVITLHQDDAQLTFRVENKIGQQKKDRLGGIGLANLKNRLDIYYPHRHILHIDKQRDRFTAVLQIALP